MPDALLRFTFGPIQGFIAKARRTADLYAGSRILAELACAVAHSFQQGGAQLVYSADLTSDPPNVIGDLRKGPGSIPIGHTTYRVFPISSFLLSAAAPHCVAGYWQRSSDDVSQFPSPQTKWKNCP